MSDSTLLVIHGKDQGRRFDLLDESITIGRGIENSIRILETEVSRQHAELRREGPNWFVTDLNSANGTYLNGRAITTSQMNPGDQIQIGRTVLLFAQEGKTTDSSAEGRISLVANLAENDRSRIISKAPPSEHTAYANWSQAGANLQLLYQITEEAVRPTNSLDEILTRILDLTLEAVKADRGCMLVADAKTDRIVPRVVSHRPGVNLGERMPISTSIVEYVIQQGQGVRTSDAQHDSRFEGGQSIMQSGIREAMCVPMQGRYELMGVIYVDTTSTGISFHRANSQQFNDSLLRLLMAIGRQSALAIENFRYQDSLITAERLAAMGQTIAIMSHHIKNILQGLQGGGYLIDMGLREQNDEMIRKGWGVIDRNQHRIYDLVMDMLTFSKEREPKLVSAHPGELVDDLVELMRPRLEEAGIELVVTPVTPVSHSLFDPEGIHRALLNLITNAIEALAHIESPQVTIRYGEDAAKELVWVEVEDNGHGLEESELNRLFTLFESNKGARGTGLGLAVSQKILQEHGGKITVRSRPGEATCFRAEWPRLLEEHELEGHQNPTGDGI